MRDAYRRNRFDNYRDAGKAWGVHYTYVGRMLHGEVPSIKVLDKLADAFNEPLSRWVALAYGTDVENESTSDLPEEPQPIPPEPPEPPPIPEAITTAIILAPTREERVRIAFDWLWLHAGELGVRFGSDRGDTVDARVAIIRAVESQLGIRLLPPDVV